MTLNVYASLFEEDLDVVSERLDAAIEKAAVSPLCPEDSTEVRRLTHLEGKKALRQGQILLRPQQDSNLRYKV